MVEQKEPGDPDSFIQKEEVAVSGATLTADQMHKETNVTCLQGSVFLPPFNELFGNSTTACIDRKVIVYTI